MRCSAFCIFVWWRSCWYNDLVWVLRYNRTGWLGAKHQFTYLLTVWFCLSLHTLAVVRFRVFPTCQLVTGGGKRKPAVVSVQHPFLHQQLPYSSVQFCSAQDGTCVLRKVHVRSTPSLRCFPNVTFETVPVFVWLTLALSRPFTEGCLAVLLPLILKWFQCLSDWRWPFLVLWRKLV